MYKHIVFQRINFGLDDELAVVCSPSHSTSLFTCTHLSLSHFLSQFLIFSETSPASATSHARKISPFCAIFQPSFLPLILFLLFTHIYHLLGLKDTTKKGYFSPSPVESSSPYSCYYHWLRLLLHKTVKPSTSSFLINSLHG